MGNPFFMIFNFKNSLFARLFTSLLLIFTAALLIITSIWYTNINKLIYNNTLSHVTDIIKSSDNQFEDNLKNISSCVQTIASVDTTVQLCKNGIDSLATEYFSNYVSGYYDINSSSIYGIAALDTDGSYFATGLPYIPDDYTSTQWFKHIIEQKGKCCFVFRNIFGKRDRADHFSVGCAVMDGPEPVGVILIDVRTSIFIKSFGTSKINGATRTIIYDTENDNIVFCNDIVLTKKQLGTLIKKATSEDLFNKIREVEFDGTAYIFTAQKSSYTKWTNITFFRKSLIYSEYKRALLFSFIFVLICLFMTVIIASVISAHLSKRINRLVTEIKLIDLANIDEFADNFETTSHDEIGIISATLSKMAKTISVQLSEIQRLSEEKRVSDIQALKSQINPHFLYNTLNVIESLADIHSNTKISSITKSLIDLLQYSVNDSSSLVSIECEIDYIKNYLKIMQAKYLGCIHVAYDIEPGLEKCKTIKMTLQPIVENCIKHALTGSENEYILIKVCRPDDDIEIKIIDNGRGISPDKLAEITNFENQSSKHLGLANVNKRIKLTFGEKYGLSILSVPDIQTAVIIKIPFIQE